VAERYSGAPERSLKGDCQSVAHNRGARGVKSFSDVLAREGWQPAKFV